MTNQQKLDVLCSSLKLSEAGINAVSNAVRHLANFERDRDQFKSGPLRKKELENLSKQAKKLQDTLKNMEPRNDWNMSYSLAELGFPGAQLNPDQDEQIRFKHWRRGIGDALDQLVKAANISVKKIPDTALREGRNSVTYFYALHIKNLAHVVCWTTNELQFGRNNDFHRLCDAIFAVAGVHAGSEGAIKYLARHREEDDRTKPFVWNYY